jgi:hypothetical protein
MRRLLINTLRLAAAALVLLVATACSDAGQQAEDQPAPSPSEPAAPASPAGPPSDQLPQEISCLNGQYRLARFVGLGNQAEYVSGDGGDVMATFNSGTYELTGAGNQPINVRVAGQQGKLTVDGAIRGSYIVDGSNVTFTAEETTGSARLRALGQTRNYSMADVAKVMDSDGGAVVSCSDNGLVIPLDNVRLELERP